MDKRAKEIADYLRALANYVEDGNISNGTWMQTKREKLDIEDSKLSEVFNVVMEYKFKN